MSGPTFHEMELKRQEMIASFKDIAAAMTRCVQIIEDYTRLSPNTLPASSLSSNIDPALVNLPTTLSAFANVHSAISAAAPAAAAEETGKKRAKKEKKPRDPDAPKRPPSAYILFQNDVRDKIRQENPGMAYKDVLAVISDKWKHLPDALRKDYETAYQLAQSTFRQNEDAYKAGKIISALPVAEESSSDSDSSDSDSSDDVPAAPAYTPQPAITPSILAAAVNSTPKKERKRKNKDVEAPVVVTPAADGEKKKKKKDQA